MIDYNKNVSDDKGDMNKLKKVCDKLLHSTNRKRRYDLYLNKTTKNEIKVSVKNYSIKDLVTDRFVNGSHLVFGSSDAGKTLYCTMLIKALVESFPKKLSIKYFTIFSSFFVLTFVSISRYIFKYISQLLHFISI